MKTITELLAAARKLPASGADDASLLLAFVLGKDRSWLYAWPEHQPDGQQLARYHELLQRRLQGIPLAYLTGRKEFWSLELDVDFSTLIPRPETELLVETALNLPIHPDARVLDLGTGSGAIALALASERPDWQISATDLSAPALKIARNNAGRHQLQGIRFLKSHWYQALPAKERYHLIVSNPPYVAENDPHLLDDGLPHEPRSALTSGTEGLDDLRIIIEEAPGFLLPDGWLIVEHGMEQGKPVRQLFDSAGFSHVETRQDLGHRDRITLGCYPRFP